jgi:hypothetical protein
MLQSLEDNKPFRYLTALEQRLNDAEALLGALICSKDSRAATLITDLSQDPLAAAILDRIAKSEFGPQGRSDHPGLASKKANSNTTDYKIDNQGLFFSFFFS